ncbi:MAG: precorrin-6y C5,15-methyltransferase (decarboxylating) subunit CbiE [Humidesulfovibrio sp.]|nr:precorrin-6y C5,15-methyltransferase (decarboxylating) subunit CbiE [Humidesulfovibrio sp.]
MFDKSQNPVHVVGLRPGTLSLPPGVDEILARAQVLVAGRRLLDAAPRSCRPEKRILVASPLAPILEEIERDQAAGKTVVVLADGDPLFFGLGKRLIEHLGAERVHVHPNLCTLQMAAARVGLPWHDVRVVSLHGRSDVTPLFAALARFERLAVFTDPENSPAAIAQALLERGVVDAQLIVLENLGAQNETARRLRLEEAWDLPFADLNLVLVERTAPPEIPLMLGIPDHYYFHEKGLITKLAVRATGLAMLGVMPDSVVWDLGAGCGSVAIEASHLAHEGRIFAVERESRRAAMIRENVRRIGAWLVETVTGEMPESLAALPDPDRVFFGGGLGQDTRSLAIACRRLKPGGRVVIHAILLDTLMRVKDYFQAQNWNFGITQIQASSADRLAGDLRLRAQNPVFIIWADKA